MSKVSRDSAPQRQDAGPVVDLRAELDGWGYVFKGKMTARYADHDEVFEVGDAFYTPPGHVPVKNEPGTEILWFSPSEELRTAEAVMMKNMQAMRSLVGDRLRLRRARSPRAQAQADRSRPTTEG